MYSTDRERILFETLSSVSTILRRLGVQFWLSSGTLLGAYREGKIIKGDNDWDLDCLTKDVQTILTARAEFEAIGLEVSYPSPHEIVPFDSKGNTIPGELLKNYIKFSHPDYGHIGDIFTYVIFSDGIARRYNLEQNSWVNPKMSVPAWYFESETTVYLYEQPFPAPPDPEIYIEKVYGPNWRVPVERHVIMKGYNFSASLFDSSIEMMVEHALKKGWKPHYPDHPCWPQDVAMYCTKSGLAWIAKHDDPKLWWAASKDAQAISPEEKLLRFRSLLAQKNEEISQLTFLVEQTQSSRYLKRLIKDYLKLKVQKLLKKIHG